MEAPTLKNPLTNARVVGENVSREVYMRQDAKRGDLDFVMSRGEIQQFAHCPHRWMAGVESDETKATEWGTLMDCLVLQPQQFETEFAVTPEKYSVTMFECPKCKSVTDSKSCRKCGVDRVPIVVEKDWTANANICAEWEAQYDGAQIVKHAVHAEALQAVASLQSHSIIREVLKHSRKQVMVVAAYHDEATGLAIPIKCLLDVVPTDKSPWPKSIADFKCEHSAAELARRYSIRDHWLHVQAAMYLDAYVVATGEDRVDFRHIVQESYAPWESVADLLSSEFLEIGRVTYLTALRRYCQCLKESYWPGYTDVSPMTRVIDGCRLIEPDSKMIL